MPTLRRLALTVLAALCAAGTAGAHTSVSMPDRPHRQALYQRWLNRSLEPSPPITIQVHALHDIASMCISAYYSDGCTLGHDMWLADTREALNDHPGFLHEIGHQFDFAANDDGLRHRFKTLLGRPDASWNEPDMFRETFAEGYASCSLHRTLPSWEDPNGDPSGGYAFFPSKRTFPKVCVLIRHAAAARGW